MTVTRQDFNFFNTLRVRSSEIDMQQVVFNAHYLTYYEVSICEFLRSIDYLYDKDFINESGHDFQLVKSVVEYKGPIFFDDLLEIGVRAGRIGRTSVMWQLGIFRAGEDELLATGEIIWVYVELAAHQSRPLPDELRQKLKPHSAPQDS